MQAKFPNSGMRYLALFGLLSILACDSPNAPDFIKASGHTETQIRVIPALPNQLIINDGMDVELVPGLKHIELTGPRNILAEIGTDQASNGELTLADNNRFKWVRAYRPVHIRVPADSLLRVIQRGFGDLLCADTLKKQNFSIQVTGASHVRIWTVSDVFALDLNGSGSAELAGRTRYAYIATRLYGYTEAPQFLVKFADLEQDGTGDTRLNIQDSIRILQKGPGCAVLRTQSGTLIKASKGTCIRYF